MTDDPDPASGERIRIPSPEPAGEDGLPEDDGIGDVAPDGEPRARTRRPIACAVRLARVDCHRALAIVVGLADLAHVAVLVAAAILLATGQDGR